MPKIKVAILGATGMIGQRFIQLLEDHPYFEIEGMYASERSEGKRLRDTMKLKDVEFRADTLERVIEQIDAKKISQRCRVAFSGLPSDVAKDVESSLAENGVGVYSNASSHRMAPDVPLLIPEVNPDHLEVIKKQSTFANGGYIVTNANCSTTGIVPPLKVIQDSFGLRMVCVSTYQAVSGAGHPGVPSLDILGNVVPFIKQEEEKMEIELLKILGTAKDGAFQYADFPFLANCARVPVIDGHLESLTVEMERGGDEEEVARAMSQFRGEPQRLELPTAPRAPIIVRKEDNRPQPIQDVNAGEPQRARGMAVTVGRIRRKDQYLKLFVLSHNTIRGGAGGSVLNAELAYAKKLLR